MKLLRFVFISVFFLAILATTFGLLFPSDVLVSRAVTIDRPLQTVLPYTNDLYAWKFWVEGMNDTSVKIYSSKQAQLGKTKVVMLVRTDSLLVTEWNSDNNYQESKMRLIPVSGSNQTIVQWQFEQKLSWYPWERFGSMMNDKIIGSMMEKNLQRLKQVAEQP